MHSRRERFTSDRTPLIISAAILMTCLILASGAAVAEIEIPKQSDWTDIKVAIQPGSPGSWDTRLDESITPSTVVKKNGTYFLYYVGADGNRADDGGPRNRTIGVATSTNGIDFVKYPGNPVITMQRGSINPEEEGAFSAAATLADNGDIVVYWERNAGTVPSKVSAHVRLAISADGFNFTDLGKVFDHTDAPWSCGGDEVGPLGAYKYAGIWYVFVLSENSCWDLGLAWGPSKLGLTNTVPLIVESELVKGGANPQFISPDKIALFVVRGAALPRSVEVRTAPAGSPQLLGDPVETYHFPDFDASAVFLDVQAGTWFMYYRRPSDGNYWVKTAPVTGDFTGDDPPAAPTGLIASAGNEQVSLNWNDSPEADVVRYDLYRAPASSGPWEVPLSSVSTSDYVDSTVIGDVDYYYVVTAVDAGNHSSVISTPANARPTRADPALDAAWRFDEGNGSVVEDASINNHDGTIAGAEWTAGRLDDALRFDRSSYVEIPDSNALDLTGDAFTVAAWIYPYSFGEGNDGRIVDKGGASSPNSWMLAVSGGIKSVWFDINNSSSIAADANAIKLNTWQHVAVTYKNGSAAIYVDGVERGRKSGLPTPGAGTQPVRIGMRATDLQRGFDGVIDEVLIYNHELSAVEVDVLAHPGPDTTAPIGPSTVIATAMGQQVELTWLAAVDAESGISAHRIYRVTTGGTSSALLAEIDGALTTYVDDATEPNTTYYYEVTAVNGAGLEGARSTAADVITGDDPPGAPTGLVASAGDRQVSLHWTENPEADVVRYDLYRALVPGGPWDVPLVSVSTSDYLDLALIGDVDYYYVVTAVDAGNNSSFISTPVSARPTGPDPTLVAAWHFDEGNGSVAEDTSYNSHYGTTAGAEWTAGRLDNALLFDRSSYVEIPDSAALDLTGGAFTVAAWIYPSSFGEGNDGRIIDKGGASAANSWMLAVSGGIKSVWFGINNATTFAAAANAINLNTWQHVAVTFDNGTATIYIDGVVRGSRSGLPTPGPGTHPVRIGMRATNLQRGFDGVIDEVLIYERELSAAEISVLAQP